MWFETHVAVHDNTLWPAATADPKVKRGKKELPHSRTNRRALGSVGDRARDALVATVSVAVVAFLIAYALSSPRVEIDAAVAAVAQHPGRQAVLHGRVLDARGDGVAQAVVRIERPDSTALVAHSGDRGYFRVELAGACAPYHVVLSVREQGQPAETALDRRLCPGEAAEVDARVTAAAQFVWVPIR